MSTALTGNTEPTTTTQAAPPPAAPVETKTSTMTVNSEPVEKSWRESLPDDLKNDPNLMTVNDIPTLAKNYIHTKKMVGADKISIPSQHSTDDDWQVVYDKLGRPKVEEYKLNLPKDSKFIDETLIKELTPLAHKSGILPKQLEGVVNWYNEKLSAADVQMETQKKADIEKGLAGLKKEYGTAYEQKLSFAHQVLKEHATPEMLELVDKDPALGNNPALIKLLSKVGELMYKEDGMPDGSNSKGSKLTPDEARFKANSILADTTHPYNNPEHPNHKAAVEEVRGMWDMAYPKDDV